MAGDKLRLSTNGRGDDGSKGYRGHDGCNWVVGVMGLGTIGAMGAAGTTSGAGTSHLSGMDWILRNEGRTLSAERCPQ
jgi:hypothetical protein